MKKAFLFLTALIFVSCSTFNVETEIHESRVKDFKKSAVMFRLGKTGSVTKKECESSLKTWLDGYNKNNSLIILENTSDKTGYYESEKARFYQVSEENEFILHKSRGIIAAYYRDNEEEIRNTFKSYDLDSLVICEVDSFFSPQLQFMSFSSVMAVLDLNGNILYLDHQYDSFKLDEFFPDPVKSKEFLMDKICTRIADNFLKFDYIAEK